MNRYLSFLSIGALALPALAFVAFTVPVHCSAADLVLFDFEGGFDFSKVPASDVKVSQSKTEAGSALRVDSGHRVDWPGITLVAPGGTWDLSKCDYIALNVRNVGTNDVQVNCRVDNSGADGVNNCNTGNIALKPGESGVLQVSFSRKPQGIPGIKLFGMRGYPTQQADTTHTIDPAKVTQLVVFVGKPTADHSFEIDNVRAGGSYTPPPADKVTAETFFPFIDTFGQYIHREWPGKTHSVAEMAERATEEAKDLAEHPRPATWDKWGGYAKGPTLKATGFFRTEKYEGKWWLVDPDGKLFWAHGMDCVRSGDYTPTDDRKTWFQDFPGDKPEFQEFWGVQGHVVNGYYAGKQPKVFNFTNANLKRKYGDSWRDLSAQQAHRRLASWGMNTIANWSDQNVYLLRQTPYTVAAGTGGKSIAGSTGYWGQFRDVFDPGFKEATQRRMAQEVGKSAGDPWCLGYFVDNELSWGDDTSLALAALQSPADQAAKIVFVNDLKAKYDTIDKLNAVWGTTYASWEGLLESRAAPDKKKAGDDLRAFYSKLAETYFRIVRDCVKEVAPNNLYLGCRFAWTNNAAAQAAAKYCDVVSYNLYRRSVADLDFAGLGDVPRIIGEFHFGALDRGMFHTGLVKVKDQAERADAYRSYMRGALLNPTFVGTGWFKYQDEPTTGRGLDGENYQIGFVDCCDTPYPETIAASREVGANMYEVRLGLVK
jgi:hypothetical protein